MRGGRCPECGREFDPADPRTYLTHPRSATTPRRIIALLVTSLLLGWLLSLCGYALLLLVVTPPGDPFHGIGPSLYIAIFVGVVYWYWSLPLALIIFAILLLRDRFKRPPD